MFTSTASFLKINCNKKRKTMYNVQIIVRLSPAIPRVVQSHKFWTPIGSITFLVDFPGSPPPPLRIPTPLVPQGIRLLVGWPPNYNCLACSELNINECACLSKSYNNKTPTNRHIKLISKLNLQSYHEKAVETWFGLPCLELSLGFLYERRILATRMTQC